MPTTPPPITISDSGTWSSPRMVSLVSPSSTPGTGGRATTEPGASRTEPELSSAFSADPGTATQPAARGDHLDAIGLEQTLHALAHRLDYPVLAALHRGPVDLRLRDSHAELGRSADCLEDLRSVDKRLGRDAAPVEAGAAPLGVLLLEDGHTRAQASGVDGGHVATGPGADHGQVVVRHRPSTIDMTGAGRPVPRRPLGGRRPGPCLPQVAVVDQHLDGQAVVRRLPTIEGPRCPVADLMAVLLRQPAQVSGPAAGGVDPRWRRHDRAAVAGLEAQLTVCAAQDPIVTLMEPSMVEPAQARGISQVGGAAQLPGEEVVEMGAPRRHPAAREAAGAVAGLQRPALGPAEQAPAATHVDWQPLPLGDGHYLGFA